MHLQQPGRTRTRFASCFREPRLGVKPVLKERGMSTLTRAEPVNQKHELTWIRLMGRQPHGPLAIDDFPGGLQVQTGTVEGVRRYMRCVCVCVA